MASVEELKKKAVENIIAAFDLGATEGFNAGREAERKRILEACADLKPILYSEDATQHVRNIARYETLEEVISLLTPSKENETNTTEA